MGGAGAAGRNPDGNGHDGRARFGRLLAAALKGRGMKQEDLAGLLGTTQSSVSGWINGKYEPAATTVFRIERALALEPGQLSRPLDYLPVDAVSAGVGVEGAILQSDELDDDQKDALIAMYQVLAGRRRAPQTAMPAGRGRLAAARSVAGSG